ncbi:MAG: hypothetical protein ACUVXD_15850, partial [Thermodesulfobacteriota bacterium]
MEVMKTSQIALLHERVGQDRHLVSLKRQLKVVVETLDLDLKPPTPDPHDNTPFGSRWGGDEVLQDSASVKVDHGIRNLHAFVGLAPCFPKGHPNAKEMPSLVPCLLVESREVRGHEFLKCPVPASAS